MRFAHPQLVWLMAVSLALLVWFLVWAWRKKQSLITCFVQSRLLPQLTVGVSRRRERWRLVLLAAAVAAAFVALARPQWGFEWEEARQKGLDIVVAVDTSRSMLAEDVRPNRLTRAKYAALDLLRLARRDRLGLVAFAGTAFLQCPLTLDDEAFRQSLSALEVNIIPQGGTALTAAIEAALTAFKDENNFKILVLFTDGEDHDSGALEAAEKAAKAGLHIFTVGVGTPNGEVLRQTDARGATSYIKDDEGNVVKSRLNEPLLQQIATATSGFYLPLRAANVMETLYEKGLAPLPKSEISSRLVRHYHERFQWPLIAAVLLLVGEMFLPVGARAARGRTAARPTAAGPVVKAAALVVALAFALAAQATPSQAQRQYDRGRFDEARREYLNLLERKPDDARLQYNAGTAAYRAAQYDQAARHFTNALTAPDLDLQQHAFYNLGDSLYRLGEQADSPDRKAHLWESSVKSFDGALKLNTNDADAKFNLELVRKKLEELKKQQQQQQQSKQDQPSDQQQNSKDQKQEQQPKENPQQNQSSQPKDQKPPEQKQEDQQKSSPKEPESKKPDQPKQSPQPQPSKDQRAEGEPPDAKDQAASESQMTLEQAQQLLDAQKDDEKAMIFLPINRPHESQPRKFKDW